MTEPSSAGTTNSNRRALKTCRGRKGEEPGLAVSTPGVRIGMR